MVLLVKEGCNYQVYQLKTISFFPLICTKLHTKFFFRGDNYISSFKENYLQIMGPKMFLCGSFLPHTSDCSCLWFCVQRCASHVTERTTEGRWTTQWAAGSVRDGTSSILTNTSTSLRSTLLLISSTHATMLHAKLAWIIVNWCLSCELICMNMICMLSHSLWAVCFLDIIYYF